MHSQLISSTCSVDLASLETSATTITSPRAARVSNWPSGLSRQSVRPLAVIAPQVYPVKFKREFAFYPKDITGV
jgi:hypothetical protein